MYVNLAPEIIVLNNNINDCTPGVSKMDSSIIGFGHIYSCK